jgi:hypothetical protein
MDIIENVVHTVACLDDGRGYRPVASLETNARFAAAVAAGVITPVRHAWGHRLTDAGRAVMVVLNARKEASKAVLRNAGFDPSKPVSEMTEAEVDAFIAFRRTQG